MRNEPSRPLVSVVIPTYNRAALLEDAIRSVMHQTLSDWELLIVDDGSTDNTAEVVANHADPRISYIRQENAGASAARNLGIAWAAGEYIAFLDSDDFWLPEKLERQVEVFERNPDAGLVGGGCVYVDEAGQSVGNPTMCPPRITSKDFEIATSLPGSGSNAMIRRSVTEAVGVFDTSFKRAEDREYWLRISRVFEVYGVQEPTVAIRLHSTPRHGINFAVIQDCRKRVNAMIDDPISRRKADAWMYFHFFTLVMQGREYGRAIGYLIRSAWRYPFRIAPTKPRLRPALELLLPRSAHSGLSRLYHASRGRNH